MSKLPLTCLILWPALGCVADLDPVNDPVDEPPAAETTYTRTTVRFADNGRATVSMEPITATQQRLEHEAAVADRTADDLRRTVAVSDCSGWTATKFFDQPYYAGNELCLIGSGNGYLDQYCRGIPSHKGCNRTWSEATRSVWTGANVVWMSAQWGTDGPCAGGYWTPLDANSIYAEVSACVQQSDQFTFVPE